MYKYKNISGRRQSIVGFGVVEADAEFESEKLIENPNFQRVNTAPVQQAQPVAPVQQPEVKEQA